MGEILNGRLAELCDWLEGRYPESADTTGTGQRDTQGAFISGIGAAFENYIANTWGLS